MTLLQRSETGIGEAGPSRGASTRGPQHYLIRASELVVALIAGAACVLLGLFAVALPTAVAWFADERSSATFWQVLGVSVDVWALAHRAELLIRDGSVAVVIAPLLLTGLLVLLCRYAVRQVLLSRGRMAEAVQVRGWRSAWQAVAGPDLIVFIVGYAAAGLLLAHTAGFGLASVHLATLVPGLLLVPLVAVLLTWWGQYRRTQQPGVAHGLRWVHDHTPVLVRRGVPAAVEVLVGLTAVGLVLVVGVLLIRGDRILTLSDTLDAGLFGTLVLTLAQLLALPNLIVWALSWLTGAGLAVGTVEVTWAETSAGDLPMIPVLGALPEPGAMPPGMWAMALVPVVAGGWIGYRAAKATSRLSTWWTKIQIALVSTALVALAAAIAGWLATGGLTPGRLGTVGVDAWLFAGLLGGEVAAGALLVVTVVHLRGKRL